MSDLEGENVCDHEHVEVHGYYVQLVRDEGFFSADRLSVTGSGALVLEKGDSIMDSRPVKGWNKNEWREFSEASASVPEHMAEGLTEL